MDTRLIFKRFLSTQKGRIEFRHRLYLVKYLNTYINK